MVVSIKDCKGAVLFSLL